MSSDGSLRHSRVHAGHILAFLKGKHVLMWSAVELQKPEAVPFLVLDLRRELFHRKAKADFGPPPLEVKAQHEQGM